jgi:hypothetical protein
MKAIKDSKNITFDYEGKVMLIKDLTNKYEFSDIEENPNLSIND